MHAPSRIAALAMAPCLLSAAARAELPLPEMEPFAEAVEACAPMEGVVMPPILPEQPVTLIIAGEVDGACRHTQLHVDDIAVECALSAEGRSTLAAHLRRLGHDREAWVWPEQNQAWHAECAILIGDVLVPSPGWATTRPD